MKNPSQLLADIVKVTRNDLGFSQSQVAERIDSDQRTVLNIENGRGNPKFKTLVSLFRVLKIDSRTVFNPELEPDVYFAPGSPPARRYTSTLSEKAVHRHGGEVHPVPGVEGRVGNVVIGVRSSVRKSSS